MFLQRLCRKTKFQELGYLYGIGKASASDYFWELVVNFRVGFVPNLVYPRSPEELKGMSREEVLRAFPDLLYLIDATNWQQQKSENFLGNRLSYSAYKHFAAYQVLLGKYDGCLTHLRFVFHTL